MREYSYTVRHPEQFSKLLLFSLPSIWPFSNACLTCFATPILPSHTVVALGANNLSEQTASHVHVCKVCSALFQPLFAIHYISLSVTKSARIGIYTGNFHQDDNMHACIIQPKSNHTPFHRNARLAISPSLST